MASSKITLTASNIKYILALNFLCKGSSSTRSISLAKMLEVTKPSVHTGINNLKEMNLVNKNRYGTVSLTSEGKKIANQYSKYYEQVSNSLSIMLTDPCDIWSATCAVLAQVPPERLCEMPDGYHQLL
ncbi:MAG: hypothetical protein ACOYJN_04685 [Acutalibacteraceae bacterium]